MKRYAAFIIVAVWLSFLYLPGGVFAQMKTGTFTVSPLIGGYVFEGNQDLKDKPAYGIGVGYNLDKQWGAEAVFNFIDTESDVNHGDVKAYLYRLDGLYHFSMDDVLVPYLAAGIGGITFDRDRGSNNNDPLVNYGAGLKYFITDTIALRGDIRHVISFDSTHHNLLYTIGLTFFFGIQPEVAARDRQDSDSDGVYDHMDMCPDTPLGVAVNSSGCPPDSDGDGVYDYMDKCPDTPSGVTVDSSGCPVDTDGDSVYDYMDKCPDTPSGVAVNSSGCPVDSDGDGVYDYMDSCPNTPFGSRVDERGCWVLKGVQFDIGKSTIKPASYPILNEVVEVLSKNPLLNIEIQGHTDSTGSAELNVKLSQNRAGSVLEYFVSKGIERTRLSCRGFGMAKPIASNATAEGRAKNRRVELKPVQ